MWIAAWFLSQASAWTLGAAHDIDPVVLDDSLYAWELQSGTVYDVLDDDGRRSGFVFVGGSQLDLTPGSSRQSKVLANRLVSFLDVPTEEARTVGEGGTLSMQVGGAVVLGASAWDAVADAARPIHNRDDVRLTTDEDGFETVLVEARRRTRRDRQLAETWLADRTRWMDEVSVEPAGVLAADRWEQEAGTAAPDRWVASLKTELDWGLYAGDLVQPRVAQNWLELLRDPSGVLDSGAPSSAWASGPEGPRVRVAQGVWTDDIPDRRVDAAGVDLQAYFTPFASGMALEMGVRADIEVVAVGGDAAHVVIDLPHIEQRAWYSAPPIPHGFEVVSVESLDGEVLPHVPVSLGPQDETRGMIRTIAVKLPETLAEGERGTVRLRYKDRHRFAHLHDYSYGMDPDIHSFGKTTGMVRVLPELRSHAADRYPVRVRAGVGPGTGKITHVVASHGRGKRTETPTGKWLRTEGDNRGLRLAVGNWYRDDVPAKDGVPSLGLHPLNRIGEFDRVAEGVGSMLRMYEPLLPTFPHKHLEMAENHRDVNSPYLQTANAMLLPGELQIHNELVSLFGGARLAVSLHKQWWSAHEVRAEDALLPTVSAWIYTMEGLRATDGDKDAKAVWRRTQATVPKGTGWSGTRAGGNPLPSLALALGPVLTDDAGGEVALFAAIDQVLMGNHEPSWDGFAAALGEATGRDWDGFLLTWVHSGTTPSVEVTYRIVDDVLVGHVSSDLPFGTFRLPIAVGSRKDRLHARVTVTDGVADFELPLEGRADKLVVDPQKVLPLRGLSVSRM